MQRQEAGHCKHQLYSNTSSGSSLFINQLKIYYEKIDFIIVAGIALSCNNDGTASKDAIKDTTATTPASATAMDYPYTIEHPDNWERRKTANTMTALNSLKAYEEGNIDESLKYFGDSIRVQFDGMDKKMSNDSLKAMLTNAWSRYKTVNMKMNDWESVVSKDKSEEWVTFGIGTVGKPRME